jgi:hypothetical protein
VLNHKEILLLKSRKDFHKIIWISKSKRHRDAVILFWIIDDSLQLWRNVKFSLECVILLLLSYLLLILSSVSFTSVIVNGSLLFSGSFLLLLLFLGGS